MSRQGGTTASALFAGFSEMRGLNRVDTAAVSVMRGSSETLLQHISLDHEALMVPVSPLHVSALSSDMQEFILRVCPYTVCRMHPGFDYEFNYARCDDLFLIGMDSRWFADIESRCVRETSSPQPTSGIETLLHPDIPPLIQSYQRHLAFPECPDEPYLEMMTELLVARFLWHREREKEADSLSFSGLTNGRLHGVLTSIEEQLDQRVLVSNLARTVSMSPPQFTRAFKSVLGVAPQRYILERRILRVQDLIENTPLGLADIALEAGFSSQAHMTAMFTRHFGITPGEYRKHVGLEEGTESGDES